MSGNVTVPGLDSNLIEIAVDVGGTFTDIVLREGNGALRIFKKPTTRADPSEAVRSVLAQLLEAKDLEADAVVRFVHGTTIATNAVLERAGARTGILTTTGFEDVLELGRQFRRDMYNIHLTPSAPVFLAPGARRIGVPERIGADGSVVVRLDEGALRGAVEALIADGVQAIAVIFLFSFINPRHEERAREIIAELAPDISVSLSHEVDPAFREYERTCVTTFDAYLKPVVHRYLETMEQDLAAAGISAPLQVMQSRGGLSASKTARQRPVRLFLSGPAAGVIGGSAVGRAAGFPHLVTVDIGGTSCDIALIRDGQPVIRSEGLIDQYEIRVPMVDVNAVGCGGGSIAWIDVGGGLRVGPQSAGSDPGPVCYGRGGNSPTVTDASLVLGYLDPDSFAGGAIKLQLERSIAAITETLAKPLNLSLEQAALGIHRVVNAQVAEGVRLVSVRRGIDPRDFTMVALGGGGPLHVTALARELGIRSILVPRFPGVLSAQGLLLAPTEHEMSCAFRHDLQRTDIADTRAAFAELDVSAGALMAAEGIDPANVSISHFADICYIGQSHYLEIAIPDGGAGGLETVYRNFISAHDRIYGHSVEAPVQLINLRTVHRVDAEVRADLPYTPVAGPPEIGSRLIHVADLDGPVAATVWEREALAVEDKITGPAIVQQADTTTVIDPGWQGLVAPDATIIITPCE